MIQTLCVFDMCVCNILIVLIAELWWNSEVCRMSEEGTEQKRDLLNCHAMNEEQFRQTTDCLNIAL